MGEPGKVQYGAITLGNKGSASQGQLTIDQQGLVWRKAGGGRKVELPKRDIVGIEWTKIPRGGALSVRRENHPTSVFVGFREGDFERLRTVSNANFGQDIAEKSLAASGRNWGDAEIDGESLQFSVDSKPLFNVALPDVTQAQQGKDEVMLEFLPDMGGGEKEDALCEMTFYVPRDNERYAGDEDTPASKVFLDAVGQFTSDAGEASLDPIATFDSVAVLAPRGRFTIELYMSFLKLVGQNQDYRIQYDALQRLFVLPKPNSPHTLVVAALDPPIRKGQTHYAHVLAHFPTDEDMELTLDLTEEQISAKNEKHKGKLAASLTGASWEVFAKALRGLSGAKLTRPGQFRSMDEGHAVRCSYKADDGYLYPLERAFFYVHKPPLLLLHEEIESVEFCRQGGGGAASTKTFDLAIRDRHEQEFLFRGIQKGEWTNLFQFISVKGLPVANLAEAERGPGGAARTLDLDLGDDIDDGLARMDADSDDEDEDFDEAAAVQAQREEDEAAAEEGSDDSDIEEAAPKPKKRPASSDAAPKPKKAKAPPKEKAEGGKPKKKRAKKDPNAPKKAMSSYMLYSNAKRAEVKADNPGFTFGEVAKKIGEMWKGASPEEKAPFEEQAAEAKEKYKEQMEEYKSKQEADGAAGSGDEGGNDSD